MVTNPRTVTITETVTIRRTGTNPTMVAIQRTVQNIDFDEMEEMYTALSMSIRLCAEKTTQDSVVLTSKPSYFKLNKIILGLVS